MKKLILTLFLILLFSNSFSQVPHLYNHTFPEINSVDPKIETLLEQIYSQDIIADVEHLTSYLNRRADGPYIYNVQEWLIEQYRSFGIDSIYLHDFEAIPFWDTIPRPFTTAPNVIAIQPGKTNPEEIIICGAHFDSTVRIEEPYDIDTVYSPGADDNATGVAGILATARILSNYEFKRTIIYANWNAEEWGLCGSNEYAKQCAADNIDIVAYFNLDMTGYLNPSDNIHVHLLYTDCDSLLGKFVQQVGNCYLPDIPTTHAWLPSGSDTDYSSFNRHGYQAISPSEDVHNMSPYIHTENDIIGLSVNNWEQTVVFTKLNLASVALAAGLTEESVNENYDINQEIISFEVYDIFGRMVYHEKNILKNIDEISVNNLESGIYIFKFFTKNDNVITRKFFVKY